MDRVAAPGPWPADLVADLKFAGRRECPGATVKLHVAPFTCRKRLQRSCADVQAECARGSGSSDNAKLGAVVSAVILKRDGAISRQWRVPYVRALGLSDLQCRVRVAVIV